jgi:hypothetical protein
LRRLDLFFLSVKALLCLFRQLSLKPDGGQNRLNQVCLKQADFFAVICSVPCPAIAGVVDALCNLMAYQRRAAVAAS